MKNIERIVCFVLGVMLILYGRWSSAARCGFVSVSDLDFGQYDVFEASTDSAMTVVYRCSDVRRNDRVQIFIRRSRGNQINPRQMRLGGERLDYNIYLDAARSIIWGDGRNGTSQYGPIQPPENNNVTVTGYGRIFGSQDVADGDYEDRLRIVMRY